MASQVLLDDGYSVYAVTATSGVASMPVPGRRSPQLLGGEFEEFRLGTSRCFCYKTRTMKQSRSKQFHGIRVVKDALPNILCYSTLPRIANMSRLMDCGHVQADRH